MKKREDWPLIETHKSEKISTQKSVKRTFIEKTTPYEAITLRILLSNFGHFIALNIATH